MLYVRVIEPVPEYVISVYVDPFGRILVDRWKTKNMTKHIERTHKTTLTQMYA